MSNEAKESLKYHISFGQELKAQKDRVRNLVEHWPEDGAYKEVLLREAIRKFIPEKYKVATGFVIKPVDRGVHKHTSQIDIIIYDHAYPVAFKQGEFVVITSDAVRAIIEVKSNFSKISKTKRLEVIKKANGNGKLIFGQYNNEDTRHVPPFFNGIFSYESRWQKKTRNEFVDDFGKILSELKSEMPNYKFFCVNHIAINDNDFVKFWPDFTLEHMTEGTNSLLSLYEIDELAFTFFISNLLDVLSIPKNLPYVMDDSVTNSILRNNRFWFPLDKGSLSVKNIRIE